MRVVFDGQCRVVRDDPSTVEHRAAHLHRAAIVAPAVQWVAVIRHPCLLLERLRESLRAGAVHHAWTGRAQGSTRSVQHAGADDGVQARLMHGIGQLGADDAIDIGGVVEFVLRLQDDQDVCMRQRPLLILDRVKESSRLAQRPAGVQIGDQGAQLLVEDARHQVRSVLHSLLGSEVASQLLPARVTRKGDKQVRRTVPGNNGHGVLVRLLHGPRTAGERCR